MISEMARVAPLGSLTLLALQAPRDDGLVRAVVPTLARVRIISVAGVVARLGEACLDQRVARIHPTDDFEVAKEAAVSVGVLNALRVSESDVASIDEGF